MPGNRGVYSLVTTFLFIMVMLFVVIGFMWLGAVLKKSKGEINDDLSKYNYIIDAKNRLLSSDCYGQVISEAGGKMPANKTCSFPQGTIKGYVIDMLAYPNCTATQKTWEHMFNDESGHMFSPKDGDSYPYFVPIKANGTANICPGRLEVIY